MKQASTFQEIIDTEIPAFRAKIRREPQKEWARRVRSLFKDLGIRGVSVKTSAMVGNIWIRIPDCRWDTSHQAIHAKIDKERKLGPWLGYGHYCPFCKAHNAAMERLEQIILAAYPDLNDRSGVRMFDFCFMVS